MSCACENRKLGEDYIRIRRLAKTLAKLERIEVVIYENHDGTYGFCKTGFEKDKPIKEFISPY